MILKALINMAFTENHTHRIFGRHLYSLLFDYGDAPFELTELDRLALISDYAHAHALPGTQALAFSALASADSGDDWLGIDDPDLLDIPPPMTYEAWNVGDEECGAE